MNIQPSWHNRWSTAPPRAPDANSRGSSGSRSPARIGGTALVYASPARSNQRVTFLAQQSYYAELLESGVKIHLYQPHFLHAKHLSIDDKVALIGSSNIDIRSFALNAEINLVIYDPEVVGELRAIQERYFADSDLVSAEAWAERPIVTRTIQNVARLADSLL